MKLLGRGGLTSALGLCLALVPSALPAGVRTIIWTGAASTDRWTDAGNWSGDVVPGTKDIARFESQAGVVLEGASSVGRLEVELADKDAVVFLDGPGKLVLTGADTVVGKPLSLAVKRGTLEIGQKLAIDLEGTRFSAQAGGTLVLRSEKIVAKEPDLKAAVSQSGTLRLGMRRWDPQMDLDLSTGSTRGRGAKVIDFALSADVPQIITFGKFKEHDGDPIVIRGFEPGDALCFSEDPRRSTDPGKELVLSAVGFEGWGTQSAAGIESTGALWCLKPQGTSLPKALVELSSVPLDSGFLPRAHLKDMHVQTLVAASERYPRNMGADMVTLRDGRYFLAFSQWLTGTTDQDDSRVMGMVSSDQGVTWGAPFPVVTADGECKSIRQPSLLRRGDGELLLFVRCREELTEAWVAMFRCRDEERIDKDPVGLDAPAPDYASAAWKAYRAEQSSDPFKYGQVATASLDAVAVGPARRKRQGHPIVVPLFRRRRGDLATEPVDAGGAGARAHGAVCRRAQGRPAAHADAHADPPPVSLHFA